MKFKAIGQPLATGLIQKNKEQPFFEHFAERSGLPIDLEVHGERMINRTFDPGFRIALHQKDLNLALSSARELGVSLPNTATAQELFNSCAAHGGKARDHSAMVRALEKLANFEIGQKAA